MAANKRETEIVAPLAKLSNEVLNVMKYDFGVCAFADFHKFDSRFTQRCGQPVDFKVKAGKCKKLLQTISQHLIAGVPIGFQENGVYVFPIKMPSKRLIVASPGNF